MREIGLEEIKNLEFDLLKRIDVVCKKEKLNYSLCGGTLLGAVRHKGFIPWDDDIDIAMPREHYIRFLKYCVSHEDECGFRIVSTMNEKGYAYLFSKACVPNTVIEEESANRDGANVGVYVDVFPIDGLGNQEEAKKHFHAKWLDLELLVAYNWKKFFKSKTHAWYFEPIRLTLFLWSRFVSPSRIIENIEKYYSQYPLDKSEYAAIVCGSYWEKEIMPTNILNEFGEVEFEGGKFMAFKKYDAYLKSIYGDYMKLPPKEKQITHHMFKAYWKD